MYSYKIISLHRKNNLVLAQEIQSNQQPNISDIKLTINGATGVKVSWTFGDKVGSKLFKNVSTSNILEPVQFYNGVDKLVVNKKNVQDNISDVFNNVYFLSVLTGERGCYKFRYGLSSYSKEQLIVSVFKQPKLLVNRSVLCFDSEFNGHLWTIKNSDSNLSGIDFRCSYFEINKDNGYYDIYEDESKKTRINVLPGF